MTERRRTPPAHTVTVAALALIAFYVYALGALYGRDPGWLIGASGNPRTNEYVAVRAAGELALQGRAADASDWERHAAQQALIVKRPVRGTDPDYFAYPYPPTYTLIAAALAALPFLPSALLWTGLTLCLYVGSVIRITGAPITGLWAAASPAALVNTYVAHTSFLTAGLFGAGLAAVPARPVLAGMCFGLLSVKPQLGLLIPVALIAGRHWRVLVSAAITSILMVIVSVAAFGVDPWLQLLPQTARVGNFVRTGHANFDLLVSIYGGLRALGVSDGLAMVPQTLAGLAIAAAVFKLWRSPAPFALKAAALAAGSTLVTPYLFIYDLTHLSIAIAFLLRQTGLGAGRDGLEREEVSMLAAAMPLMLLLAILPLPLGVLANLLVGAVILGRIWPYLLPANARLAGGTSRLG